MFTSLQQFPTFLLRQILGYLYSSPVDLFSLLCTCKAIRALDNDDHVWELLYKKTFKRPTQGKVDDEKTWRANFLARYCRRLPETKHRLPMLQGAITRAPAMAGGMQSVKCVVVGTAGVGKTCFCAAVALGAFPAFIPTVWDNESVQHTVQPSGVSVNLGL
jgi:hypothetical protein